MTELIETVLGSPPEGWTLGHVTVSLKSGRASVEAFRRGAFAVHEDVGNTFRLTHAPTGLLISTFDDMDCAAAAAEAIEPLADWNAITKEVPPDSELKGKVFTAIERAIMGWQKAGKAGAG